MNRKHGRLVDREEVLVFVDDGHVAWSRRFVPGGPPQEHSLLGLNARVRAQLAPARVVGTGPNDGLGSGSARAVKLRAHEDVEPLSGDLGGCEIR